MKPKILLSKCFSQPVRYDGGIVTNDFINKLKKYIEFFDHCPEVEIGLGVPRQRLIIVKSGNSKNFFQPDTKKDFTEIIHGYNTKILNSMPEIDGAILKAKSPSCGVGSTKLYKDGVIVGKTYGFFAESFKKIFPHIPLEDEERLRNDVIRTHFLTRIFAFSELRTLLKNPEPKTLVLFHSKYKYLLMAYNQKMLKELGQLVGDATIPFEEKIKKYKIRFYKTFSKQPSPKRHVNTIMHLLGYVSKNINAKEKEHFLNLINKYIKGKIPLKLILELLKNLSYRCGHEYILMQKYLEPYPEDLDL